MPFVKVTTKIYPIDLSQLNKVNVDDENIANTNTMLTINELGYTLDSLHKNLKTEIVSYSENINLRTESQITISFQNGSRKKKTLPADILSVYTNKQKLEILKIANSNTVSTGYSIDATKVNLENKQKTSTTINLLFR
jgi:lipopolysaccharide export system permease protein